MLASIAQLTPGTGTLLFHWVGQLDFWPSAARTPSSRPDRPLSACTNDSRPFLATPLRQLFCLFPSRNKRKSPGEDGANCFRPRPSSRETQKKNASPLEPGKRAWWKKTAKVSGRDAAFQRERHKNTARDTSQRERRATACFTLRRAIEIFRTGAVPAVEFQQTLCCD